MKSFIHKLGALAVALLSFVALGIPQAGANNFSKEERVAFEDLLAGFDDALVLSSTVSKFNTNPSEMERSADILWRPQPYIAQSFTGMDMTANFKTFTQLSVPARINIQKSSPWTMTALELRDALQEGRLLEAAKQKLGSDINVALNAVATAQGTLVVKRTVAATGFDDVAQAEAIMNEQGVQIGSGRFFGLSTRDYNGMASNLAARAMMNELPTTAYARALVGSNVASFDLLKMDYSPRQAAATATGVVINGANQFFTPLAGVADVNGGLVNQDNRFQTIALTVGASTVKVGDAFTVAGVNAVHHITKADTGQLKTFRIIAIVTGAGGTGTMQIAPPFISGQGATDAELEYQNITATPANGAALTFLNTVAAAVNPFWYRDALEILPGTIAWPEGAGVEIMKGTTEQGFTLYMLKWVDIKTGNIFYRVDTRFGVVNKQPEMSGIMLFSQT